MRKKIINNSETQKSRFEIVEYTVFLEMTILYYKDISSYC